MNSAPKQGASFARIGGWISISAIIVFALAFRLIALGNLPGINGDEAWYGVLAQKIAAGEDLTWRTPSGNLPGPFQLGMLLILQALFEPSFTLLRVPSLLSSIAAAGLSGWVVQRHFGRRAGLIAVLLMAILPINIAYARFGWDPSHVPLIGLAAAALALANRPLACVIVFAVAMTVHPTSIFIAPFLVLTVLGATKQRSPLRKALIGARFAATLLLAALAVLGVTTSGDNVSVHPAEMLARLVNPRQWVTFVVLYGRLLSGDTVYQYIAGAGFGPWRRIIDPLTIFLLLGLVGSGLWALRRRAFGLEAGVVTGWLACLLGFFIVAGNGAIMPDFERYAMCLIAPSVIALSVLAREAGHRRERLTKPLLVAILIAFLLLAGFGQYYLRALQTTGSLSHRAFRTGPAEPKQAAFEAVVAEAEGRPVQLMAEDWWLAWPIAYLAAGKSITVTDVSALPPGPIPSGRLWLTFAGSDVDRRLKASPGATLQRTIGGTNRPTLLHLWRTGARATIRRRSPA